MAVRVLLTETAAHRAERLVDDLGSAVRLLRMQHDGAILDAGTKVEWEDAAADAAWLSFDLFEESGPSRQFFGFLLRSETLRWLQLSNAGIDHPIFTDLHRRGLRLTTAHVTDIPIAEYVIRAVLDHYQAPQEWRAAQRDEEWRRHDFREISGTTWLVIGLGAIGSAVATRVRAFGAQVIGVRRTPSGTEPVDRMLAPTDVAGAIGAADVILVAAPATAATHQLVDREFLSAMKDGSVLVNIARGSLVDEAALIEALDRERGIEAAVLDVTDVEPLPPGSPLWTHRAVTITPHNAAGGTGRADRAARLFADNLRRYLAGQPLLHEVTEADLP
jgi:phosphoglycerate dehydrogenase-like enzyme